MFLGLLNFASSPVKTELEYVIENTTTVPEAKISGNPLRKESLFIQGNLLHDNGVDLRIHLSEPCFVDTVTVRFSEGCSAAGITVFDPDGAVLSRYAAETGKHITENPVSLTADACISGLLIRIHGSYDDIGIDEIELFGAAGKDNGLFPEVKKYIASDGEIDLPEVDGISADSPLGKKAASVLCTLWEEHVGTKLKYTEHGFIRIRENCSLPADAYHLSAKETGICIEASSLRGMVIASHRLLQLTKNTVPCFEIEDAPFQSFRGVHLFLPGYENLDFAYRLIRNWISPMGYNYVIMEVAGGMRFASHPEISDAVIEAKRKGKEGIWPPFPHGGPGGDSILEKEDAAAYVDYIRSFGIEVIPEVQSLGHVQYMTVAHPEIAEIDPEAPKSTVIDERMADIPPARFYHHCYCPSNEKSYEILFDLLDEIIEVFRPAEYVHMGHDEVYQIGVCPVCRKKDPAILFEKDVIRLHDRLKEKGLKMIIWSDMINQSGTYATKQAIHHLPSDILMMDFTWYFHLDEDIETCLPDNGYHCILGNLYSSHFPRYESRIRRKGILGGEISAWVPSREDDLQRTGKLYDFLYTAEMLWSDRYDQRLRPSYHRMICKILPGMRDRLRGISSPSLRRNSKINTVFECNDIWNGEINLNCKFSSILLTHTAPDKHENIPWAESPVIGQYELVYCDGTVEKIPVTYGGNIGWIKKMYGDPYKAAYHRHTGYTATYYTDSEQERLPDGSRNQWFRLEIMNPKPETTVDRLQYVPAENAISGLLLRHAEIVQ